MKEGAARIVSNEVHERGQGGGGGGKEESVRERKRGERRGFIELGVTNVALAPRIG